MHQDDLKWLQQPLSGTRPADLPFLAMADTFVSGDPSNHRLSIRYYQNEDDGTMVGKVLFGPGTQGPPDHAHGGSMAALLDEAMGGAAWLAGHPVVAAQLNITFRAMLPLGTRCLVYARVLESNGRKIKTTGEIASIDGQQVFSSGEALFVTLDHKKIEQLSEKAKVIVDRMREQEKR